MPCRAQNSLGAPEEDAVRVTLHDRDGKVLYQGDVNCWDAPEAAAHRPRGPRPAGGPASGRMTLRGMGRRVLFEGEVRQDFAASVRATWLHSLLWRVSLESRLSEH